MRGPHTAPRLVWRVRARHRVFASPILAAGWLVPEPPRDAVAEAALGAPGLVVFAGIDGALHGVDGAGVERWAAGSRGAVFATPCVAARRMIVARDGALDAFDDRGALAWSHPLTGDVDASPAVGPDGTVYVATRRLEAIAPATGQPRWQTTLADHVSGAPAVTRDGSTVVVADASGEVAWVRASDGVVARRARVGAPVRGGVLVLDDGTVVVGASDGHVRAFGPDGTVRWDAATRDEVRATPVLSRDGATVLVGSDDGGIYGLRVRDGAVAFRVATSGRVRSSAAVDADGFAFVGSEDDVLYALDPSGAVAWSVNLGADVDATPLVLPSGALAVGADDGALSLLAARAGAR